MLFTHRSGNSLCYGCGRQIPQADSNDAVILNPCMRCIHDRLSYFICPELADKHLDSDVRTHPVRFEKVRILTEHLDLGYAYSRDTEFPKAGFHDGQAG